MGTPVDKMPAYMKDAYGLTMKLRGQVPGPHKRWLANPTLFRTIVLTGKYHPTESTLQKAEVGIVTNIIYSRWLVAYPDYQHENIAEESGHLPPEKVEALIASLPTSFDDPRQQMVHELASMLAQPRVVPKGMYRRAKALLGDERLCGRA